jgi:hypothetical protein
MHPQRISIGTSWQCQRSISVSSNSDGTLAVKGGRTCIGCGKRVNIRVGIGKRITKQVF